MKRVIQVVNRRILILCEDEKSEKMYFDSFKRDEDLKKKLASVTVLHPMNHDPVGLVETAKGMIKSANYQGNSYDAVFVVFDKDRHAKIDKAFQMAYDNGIHVIFSNICFEVWIYLHRFYSTKSFSNKDEVVDYIRKNHYRNYAVSSDFFDALRSETETAIFNGEKLIKHSKIDIDRGKSLKSLGSYTNVSMLVKVLLNPETITRVKLLRLK